MAMNDKGGPLHQVVLSDAEWSLLQKMRRHLADEIAAAGGTLPFDRYMEMALYAPALGYYVNGRRKFGEEGDFTTAPELSPLFGQCLAQQLAECLRHIGGGSLFEMGAGSGRLAADLLRGLDSLDALPREYLILELSPSLQALQRETLQAEVPALSRRVRWLQSLPAVGFQGVVFGNELLDAMPVHRFRRHAKEWQELAVESGEDGLSDRWLALFTPGLGDALDRLWPSSAGVADGYQSEVNLRLEPWLRALVERMQRGYLVVIDYGYPRHEYYHPERNQGTLICHFRHRAYADPYLLPGLQDMTAHVDFSALAEAAQRHGMQLAGYTTQSHFLIDSGLERLLATSNPNDVQRHVQLMQGVKRLTLPSEMGEKFKVMALALNATTELSGFLTRDLRGRL